MVYEIDREFLCLVIKSWNLVMNFGFFFYDVWSCETGEIKVTVV